MLKFLKMVKFLKVWPNKSDNCKMTQGNQGNSIWETITEDDLKEIKEWIKENRSSIHIKKCPKCKAFVELNPGDMCITCPRCKHSFCWMCGKDWKTHQYCHTCPYYKPEEDPFVKLYQ